MEPENLESNTKVSPVRTGAPIEPVREDSLDAKILVQQLIEAGEWPCPDLLDRIVIAESAAVELLLDVLRRVPTSRPNPDALRNIMGLLSALSPPQAIPELVRLIHHDEVHHSADAADALAQCGDAGFEALVELCKSESLKGYRRAYVFDAAAFAALDKPARKTRLGEILRPILDDAIATAREELKKVGWLEKRPPEEDFMDDDEFDELDDEELDDDNEAISGSIQDVEDRLDTDALDRLDHSTDDDEEDFDEDLEVDTYIAEDVAFLVGSLATIADPVAHGTILTVFREGLVDESTTSRERVDKSYAEAKEWVADEEVDWNWLDYYRLDFEEHLEVSGQLSRPAPTSRAKYRYEDRYDEGEPPPDIPATAPIRNAQPKLGRNDPCWCGRGKKFKKCHLGKNREKTGTE